MHRQKRPRQVPRHCTTHRARFPRTRLPGRPLSPRNPLRGPIGNRVLSTKYLDEETGLYHYEYRQYSTALGRWLSRDPLAENPGHRMQLPYIYCDNEPVHKVDGLGLTWWNPSSWLSSDRCEDCVEVYSGGRKISSTPEVIIYPSSFSWGSFLDQPYHAQEKGHLRFNVFITLDPLLPLTAPRGSKLSYTEHYAPSSASIPLGGHTTTSGNQNSKPLRSWILAHEQGHAEAFFSCELPCLREKLRDLCCTAITQPLLDRLESDLRACRSHCAQESARLANFNTRVFPVFNLGWKRLLPEGDVGLSYYYHSEFSSVPTDIWEAE
jgi:RHS repeat-associated protein